MKKAAQSLMYLIPLAMVIGVFALFIGSGRSTGQTSTTADEEKQKVTQEEHAQAQINQQMTEDKSETEQQITEDEIENEKAEDESESVSEPASENAKISGDTTILFTGDVLFANAFKAGYDAKGIAGVISEDLLKKLQDADILMMNNEFPFSEQGTPMEGKQYTFRCEPSYVKALQEMGVDVVSLANNHVLDYGKEALSDTFVTLDKAGILYGGAGETVERAKEVQIIEVNGRTYGFLAVSRVVPIASWKVENSTPGVFSCYDDTQLVELVEQASEECDFLAVYPHWGVEYEAYPESYQTQIAQNCIDAGADLIVGAHTHCLQGVEYIEDTPVFYSLGNFVFGQTIDRSAILELTISADGEVTYRYLPVYAQGGVTKLASGEKAVQICNYLNQISDKAFVAEDGTVTKKKE